MQEQNTSQDTKQAATILLGFFDLCRRATSLSEINVAAGIAMQELLTPQDAAA
jgi:hypothetical protein